MAYPTKELQAEYDKQYRLMNQDKIRARNNKWNAAHKDERAEKERNRRFELKISALESYSDSICCNNCGESDVDVLAIDHINNDGYAHRLANPGWYFYQWLKNNNYPEGYQVLCFNCNWKKHLEYKRNVTRSS